MFPKSFRGFSTFDFLTLVTSVTAVAAIAGPIVHRSINAERILQAEREMKKHAFQVAQKGASLQDEGRKIASAEPEELGQDPWGKPYQVKLIRNSYGLPTHVVIWSTGPNQQLETKDIDSHRRSGAMAVVFEGDDVGFVASIHH